MKHLKKIFLILMVILSALLNSYAAEEPFTIIFASDPQLPWWRTAEDPNCQSDECVEQQAVVTNTSQSNAMNNIRGTKYYHDGSADVGIWPNVPNLTIGGGTAIKEPVAVIMNGDLTAFWHPWQYNLYRRFYDPGYDGAVPQVLRLNIFPGLGNHDYKNNIGQCGMIDKNDCAKKAIAYIHDMVNNETVMNFNPYVIQSFDKNSVAYSFEIKGYHFVQLNLDPTYEESSIGIHSSIPWLTVDLANASARNKKIVINMHDYGEYMSRNNPEFLAAIAGQNVVALFAGHYHSSHGYKDYIPGTKIPYFRSGAAEFYTSLLVEFGDTYMNVGVIDSERWSGQFKVPHVATKKSIAIAEYNNQLYAVWNGHNDDGIYYASFNGTTWNTKQLINGVSTRDAPSVAVHNGKLYVTWNGYNEDGIFYTSFDGNSWSTRSQIPEVTTKDSPALAEYNNKLYAAWNGFHNDGIFYAHFDGSSWSTQSKISGVATQDAPALASHKGKLCASWNGYHDDGIFYASFDGAWSPQEKLPTGRTSQGPGLASYNDRLFAIWDGVSDDGIFYASLSDGPKFLEPTSNDNLATYSLPPYTPIPGNGSFWTFQSRIKGVSSQQAPAFAAFNNKLYAVWNGHRNDGIYYASFDGITWSPQQKIGGVSTRDAPAVAVYNGKIYAAWNGFHDDGIFYAYFDGSSWSTQSKIPGVATKDAPALAVSHNKLYTAWNGFHNDGIFYASFDGSWSTQSKINGVATQDAPALASFNNQLYAAWNGFHDDGIFYAHFNGSSWSTQSKIPGVATKDAPALAPYNGKLYAAWNGYHNDGIFYASFNGSWSSKEKANISGLVNSESPSLGPFNDRLYLGWANDGIRTANYAAW